MSAFQIGYRMDWTTGNILIWWYSESFSVAAKAYGKGRRGLKKMTRQRRHVNYLPSSCLLYSTCHHVHVLFLYVCENSIWMPTPNPPGSPLNVTPICLSKTIAPPPECTLSDTQIPIQPTNRFSKRARIFIRMKNNYMNIINSPSF